MLSFTMNGGNITNAIFNLQSSPEQSPARVEFPENDRMDNITINNEPEDASSASSNAGFGDRSVHENSPDSADSSTEDIWQQQLQRSLDDNRINVEIASSK